VKGLADINELLHFVQNDNTWKDYIKRKFVMKKISLKLFLTLVASLTLATLLLAACGDPTATSVPTTTAVATTTAGAATTSAPATTTAPAQTTTTTIPTVTPAPTTGTKPTATPQIDSGTTAPPIGPFNPADVNKNLFIDDRSNPLQLIRSYYNAINRHEFVRAYAYWNGNDQPYPDFEKGFATTAEVTIRVSTLTGGAAAGTTYYSLPIVLTATDTAGKNQMYVGFYEIALSTPSNYGMPPILPMHINKGIVQPLTMANPTDQLTALIQSNQIPREGAIKITPDDGKSVDASVYLDSHSTPQEVLRSYYNSINRKEYVRAYSYWRDNPTAYAQFEKGFATTATVQITMGQVIADAATGHRLYKVPAVIVSSLTDGKAQTFAGCYNLEKLDPAFYVKPPFMPLGIASANIKEVPTTSTPADLLAQGCK